MYSQSVFNALHIEIKYKCYKNFFRTKSTLKLITILLLICDFYMNWSTSFCSLKLYAGFSRFRFRFIFIKVYIFAQQNAWTLWLYNVTISFKIKIIEKPHTVLQQVVWKFNDTACVGARKNRPGDKFYPLRKLKFWERQFSSIVTFK